MVINSARYTYGVASSGCAASLGRIGIDGNEVYTIPYGELCAIVHDCPAEPYRSGDSDTVKKWVTIHQSVLDEAKTRFCSVIPMSFDTILQPRDAGVSPEQTVKDWLSTDYECLQSIMQKIIGRDEYGVQIFYELGAIGKRISENSKEIIPITDRITREMAAGAPGIAYIYRQKLQRALKDEMEKFADERFRDFYGCIKCRCDDIVVETTRKTERDKVMLMNLSCLVARDEVESLGDELEEINRTAGFSVHFSGPWPPYSFVARPAVAGVKTK